MEEDSVVRLDADDVEETIELDENGVGNLNDVAGDLDELDIEEGPVNEASGENVNGEGTDDSDVIFPHHSDAVFCVRVEPTTGGIAVTGGQDDKALVWDIASGQTVFECAGHTDSVTSVGFSHDGAYLATADMKGLIKVWEVSSWQEAWSFECSDIEWLEWHPAAAVLLAGTTDGDTWMWKIPSGDCKTLQGHGQTVNCGRFLPDGKRACTGYSDGAVKVWDLRTATVLHSITGHDAHTGDVLTLDCHPNNSLVITGSADVTAKLVNTQSGKVLTTLNCRGDEEADDSVEAVGLSHTQALAATGTLSGQLSIWDIPNQVVRHTCPHPAGIVKVAWDSTASMVYSACLDGTLRLWDARTGQTVSRWSGHQGEILDFDISRDGSTLVSTSEDKTARVFSLHVPER